MTKLFLNVTLLSASCPLFSAELIDLQTALSELVTHIQPAKPKPEEPGAPRGIQNNFGSCRFNSTLQILAPVLRKKIAEEQSKPGSFLHSTQEYFTLPKDKLFHLDDLYKAVCKKTKFKLFQHNKSILGDVAEELEPCCRENIGAFITFPELSGGDMEPKASSLIQDLTTQKSLSSEWCIVEPSYTRARILAINEISGNQSHQEKLTAFFAIPRYSAQSTFVSGGNTYRLVGIQWNVFFSIFTQHYIQYTGSIKGGEGNIFDNHFCAYVRYGDTWYFTDDTYVAPIRVDGAHTIESVAQFLLDSMPGIISALVFEKIGPSEQENDQIKIGDSKIPCALFIGGSKAPVTKDLLANAQQFNEIWYNPNRKLISPDAYAKFIQQKTEEEIDGRKTYLMHNGLWYKRVLDPKKRKAIEQYFLKSNAPFSQAEKDIAQILQMPEEWIMVIYYNQEQQGFKEKSKCRESISEIIRQKIQPRPQVYYLDAYVQEMQY